MFEFTVIGLNVGTYTNKHGDVKPYTRIYATYPLDDSKHSNCSVSGMGCDVFFVNRQLDDIYVGDTFSPVYNKFGTCVDIIVH